jgi:hypothetical protein
MPWRRLTTTLLLSACVLSWLHYTVASPGTTGLWVDGIAFWAGVAGLALLWGLGTARRALRFFADWARSEAEGRALVRFLVIVLFGTTILRLYYRDHPVGLIASALVLGSFAGLLVVTGMQDARRWRSGERWPALRWALVLGVLGAFAYLLVEGPDARQTPPMMVGALCFWGLLALLLWQWARRTLGRLRRRREGGDGGLTPPAVQ